MDEGCQWVVYVLVAAPNFRRTFAKLLNTPGGVASRSAGEMPPLSSLIESIISRAASLDRFDMLDNESLEIHPLQLLSNSLTWSECK